MRLHSKVSLKSFSDIWPSDFSFRAVGRRWTLYFIFSKTFNENLIIQLKKWPYLSLREFSQAEYFYVTITQMKKPNTIRNPEVPFHLSFQSVLPPSTHQGQLSPDFLLQKWLLIPEMTSYCLYCTLYKWGLRVYAHFLWVKEARHNILILSVVADQVCDWVLHHMNVPWHLPYLPNEG